MTELPRLTNPPAGFPRGAGEEQAYEPEPASPARLAWRRLRRNRSAIIGATILAVMYLITTFGSFVEPYDPGERNYAQTNHPPMLPRFVDEKGKFHFRPFVFGMRMVDPMRQKYEFDLKQRYPIYFFVKGFPYKLWGFIPMDRHLFGIDAPETERFALFGTDAVGKDVFSRVIQGGKVSMSIGLIAIAISLVIGMSMGGIAGYFGGWIDTIIMRVVEFLLSIPTLYLIIALRAFFQTKTVFGIGGATITSTQMYIIIIVILSLIGWAGQARVIRGMVLSIKEQDFVTAERAMGATVPRIIARHILPNTLSYVIVSVTIAIPGYILGEVALSYLGVGIQEPQVSWGIMLSQAQSVATIQDFPWLLFAPGFFIFITVFAFNFLGDGLRDALDPRHTK